MRYAKLSFQQLETRIALSASSVDLSYSNGVIEVPGTAQDLVTLSATWTRKDAEYDNEVLFFDFDDAAEDAGNGESDSELALHLLRTFPEKVTRLFDSGSGVGASTSLVLPGGSRLGTAIIQDTTVENWLATNPANQVGAGRLAFFSLMDANPDAFDHVRINNVPNSGLELAWEDLAYGGDRDFTDVVFTLDVVEIEHTVPQELRFELVDGPSGAAIDLQTGELNWQELGPGTHQFTVTVSADSSTPESPKLPTDEFLPGQLPGLSDNSEVFVEDFERDELANFWTDCSFCGGHSIVKNDGTGNQVFDTIYSRDEQAAQLSVYPLDDVESVFVSFNHKFPTGHTQWDLKSARVFQASGDKEATFGLDFWPNLVTGAPQVLTYQQGTGGGDYTPFDYGVNEWVRVSFLMRLNDPGQDNGVLQVWRNDEAVIDFHNVSFRHNSAQPDGVWVGGNYTGAGVDPVPFHRLLDDVLIITNPAADFDHLRALDAAFSAA